MGVGRTTRDPAIPLLTAGVCLYVFGLFVVACWKHGLFIDEIWSLWLGERSMSLAQLARERWVVDVNPPLFYVWTWLTEPVTGHDIFLRRMTNFVPVAIFAGALCLVSAADRRCARFSVVFFVLAITLQQFVFQFSEFRGYIWTAGFAGSAIALLYYVIQSGRDLSGRRDVWIAVALAASVGLMLNIHYISTGALGLMLGTIALYLLRARRWRWFAVLAATVLVALVPLGIGLLSALAYMKNIVGAVWLQTTPPQAARMLVTNGAQAALGNLVAALAAAAAAYAWLRRKREPSIRILGVEVRAPEAGPWSYALAMTAAVSVACAGLFIANAITPILTGRYLITVTLMIVAVVAALSAETLTARRWLFAAFALNAALLGTWWSITPITHPRWNDTAEHIQREVQACPTAKVYGIDPGYVTPYTGAPNQPEVQDWGYIMMGGELGFPVSIVETEDATPTPLAERCPTYFWMEHLFSPREKKQGLPQFLATRFGRSPQMAGLLRSAHVYQGDTGFVLKVGPAKPGVRSLP